MLNLSYLNNYRDKEAEMKIYGCNGDSGNGVFVIKSIFSPGRLYVIASNGDGWDHISVSKKNCLPNWNEMNYIKDAFFHPEDVVMQLHPPKSKYVNMAKYCLHLWRPNYGPCIPCPPSYMVGFK